MNDYVRIYQERFWTLWNLLKNFFTAEYTCTGYCNQGRNCNCKIPMDLQFSDMIIRLHYLARNIEDHEESIKVRLLADELAKIGNRLHKKNLEIRNPEESSRK
jgi:hypothetical protein